VDAYNAGTLNAERFFEKLKRLIGEMDEEERRAAREGLTEDELAGCPSHCRAVQSHASGCFLGDP
jgi:hypothetical protein